MKTKNFSFRTAKRHLRMEQLEHRRLMAADVGLPGEYWLIEGTDGPDEIVVWQEGTMMKARVGEDVSEASVFRYDGVAVQAKAGNDSITIENSLILPTRLHGGHGDDTIVGSLQNDVISGGVGNDNIYARAGNDQVWGDQMPIPEDASLRPPDDGVEQVEQLVQPPVQAPANDVICGGYGDDELHGGPGDDFLYGETGPISEVLPPPVQDSRIAGELSPDSPEVGVYHDYLFGEEGEDHLHGGPQRDFFDGGRHADTIRAIDGYVDLIVCGPRDTVFHDADDIIFHYPQPVPLEPATSDLQASAASEPGVVNPENPVSMKIRDFYIDEAASTPSEPLEKLPTAAGDFDDWDDLLEDLIDYPWW